MECYAVNGILKDSANGDKPKGLLGNLVAVTTNLPDDLSSQEIINRYAGIILDRTREENFFVGQEVNVIAMVSLESPMGDIKYVSNTFKLNNSQQPITDFESEIDKLFQQQVDPEKRILCAENMEGFPLVIFPEIGRSRNRLFLNDFPNITFEYRLPESEIYLVSFGYNDGPANLKEWFNNLDGEGYKVQQISPKLGKKLIDPKHKISLVDRIAKGWVRN